MRRSDTATAGVRNGGLARSISSVAIVVLVFCWFAALLLARRTGFLVSLLAVATIAAFVVGRMRSVTRYLLDAARGNQRLVLAAVLVLSVALPLLFPRNPYTLHILVIACVQTIAALGLNLQVGNAGLPNLGFAAFYGIGAYTSALFAVDLQASFWVGLLAAIVVCAILGVVLGFPALRTKPVYLALVTIASGLVLYNLFLNVGFLHGPDGVRGVPAPAILGRSLFSDVTLFGITYPSQLLFYYFCLAFLAITILVARLIGLSPTGIALNAIRENEIAARSVGINVARGKLLAFSVGSVFGGIAGALYAHYIGYISAQNFTIGVSFALLAMVILGGSGNILGVTLAAILLTVLPEKFRALSDYRLLAYGVLIVTMLIFRPQGLIPERIRQYRMGTGKSGEADR